MGERERTFYFKHCRNNSTINHHYSFSGSLSHTMAYASASTTTTATLSISCLQRQSVFPEFSKIKPGEWEMKIWIYRLWRLEIYGQLRYEMNAKWYLFILFVRLCVWSMWDFLLNKQTNFFKIVMNIFVFFYLWVD